MQGVKEFFTKTPKVLILFLLAIFAFLNFDVLSEIVTEDDDIVIDYYLANIRFTSEGDMMVREVYVMTYNEHFNVRFRDIDYNKYPNNYPLYKSADNNANFDTESVRVKVYKNSINITSEIGLGYSFENDYDERNERVRCEPYRAYCVSLFTNLMGVGGLEGDIRFDYEYTIKGVVTEYSDVSEINWILFDYMEADIDHAMIYITLPDNMEQMEDIELFSHGVEDTQFRKESSTKLAIEYSNVDKSDPIGFRLFAPTAVFADIKEDNIVIHESMNRESLLAFENDLNDRFDIGETLHEFEVVILAAGVLLFGLITAIVYAMFFKKFRVGKGYSAYTNNDVPSDHTPAEIGYLYKKRKTNENDVSATVLDLIVKDVLLVDQEMDFKDGEAMDLTLKLNPDYDESELKKHEIHLIEWFIRIIGSENAVAMSAVENYGAKELSKSKSFMSKNKEFHRLVAYEARQNGFFDVFLKRNKKIAYMFCLVPVLFIAAILYIYEVYFMLLVPSLLTSFLLIIIYVPFVYTRDRRSLKGEKLYRNWDNYYQLLLKDINMERSNVGDIQFWEKRLVYATSFGISARVIEQLKEVLPMTEALAKDSRFLGFGYGSPYYSYGFSTSHINHSFRRGRRSSRNRVLASRVSSSGSGRSSGFGGGFSGGGGGGGGRSR